MRAKYRKECTGLKQKEDELQSDIFLREQRVKQLSKRNEEESTRISSTQLEIDRYVIKNQSMRSEVQELEDELEEKKNAIGRSKTKLADLASVQSQLEESIRTQSKRVRQSKVQLEGVAR